jgi:hypothetical protein
MKTIECSNCEEQVQIERSWLYQFGAQVECPGCGFWINPRDGKAQISARDTGSQRPLEDSYQNEAVDYGEAGEEALRGIPGCYYLLAILCGGVFLVFTIMVSDDLSADETGGMIGWIIGVVLAMLAIGRLVQLVQRISDDIRIIRDGTMNGSEETVDKSESVPPSEDDPQ